MVVGLRSWECGRYDWGRDTTNNHQTAYRFYTRANHRLVLKRPSVQKCFSGSIHSILREKNLERKKLRISLQQKWGQQIVFVLKRWVFFCVLDDFSTFCWFCNPPRNSKKYYLPIGSFSWGKPLPGKPGTLHHYFGPWRILQKVTSQNRSTIQPIGISPQLRMPRMPTERWWFLWGRGWVTQRLYPPVTCQWEIPNSMKVLS